MALDDAIRKRVEELLAGVEELVRLADEFDQITDGRSRSRCRAWMVATQNIVHQICEGTTTPYLRNANLIVQTNAHYEAHHYVLELADLLKNLRSDVEAGLISSADRASAETFANFLEHGEEYLKQSRKNESGVIVGVVFEDTVRRMCRKYDIAEAGVDLDKLISALVAKGKLTASKATRAGAAAHVRTKATHAQWEGFDLADVESAIIFTREIINTSLNI